MKYVATILAYLLATSAFAAEVPLPPKRPTDLGDQVPCSQNAVMEKVLNERGYRHLMDITTPKNEVQSMWIAGESIIVSAQNEDKKTSCLLSKFHDVTLNPNTIETIYNIYKQSQKEM